MEPRHAESPSPSFSRPQLLFGLVVAAAALGACGSGSAADSGVVVIETKLAEDIDLGDLEATCNEPDGLKEGETFTCTATTTDDQIIEFLGTMTGEDKFDIVTTNLLTVSDISTIVPDAAQALSDVVGQEILPEDISCSEGNVILDADDSFVCAITDASTGDVYDLTVNTGGLVPGVGANKLEYAIADQPR